MKFFKNAFCLVLASFTFSCNSDDTEQADELIANWNLIATEKQGLEIPASGCEISHTITFNVNGSGNNIFPENDQGEPCDFETLEFNWTRTNNELLINSIEEGSFSVQILVLNNTELQIVVSSRNGEMIPPNEQTIFKYEK